MPRNTAAVRALLTPDLPPRCSDRFDVVRPIATGGFGAVWLARHRELSRAVALKFLHGETARQPAAFQRFLNEARVTAQLEHPHIVKVLDHDVEDGRAWIAYEYLGDVTLQSMIDRRGALGVGEGLLVAAQLADALEAAHALGVVHRDIKPENVIAAEPGYYKLIDFGVAAGNGTVRTGINQIMGTPAYLTPEQLKCQGASPKTDQYQLGILLYQMLTGEVPHHDPSLQTLLVRRASFAPRPPSSLAPEVGADLDAVVMKMLATDPRDRYENMRAARHALEVVAAGEAPRATQGTTRRTRVQAMSSSTAKVVLMRQPAQSWREMAAKVAFQLGAMSCGGLLFMIMLRMLGG